MVCMVSGVLFQGWDVGTLGNTLSRCVTQDPVPQEASTIHPTHTNVCVWMWTHVVCIHKAHFPSSPRSVVSLVRLSRGASESLASDYTLGTAVTALLCGCSVIKLNFYFHQTASWLWLVWTNSPVFTPKMADDHDVK